MSTGKSFSSAAMPSSAACMDVSSRARCCRRQPANYTYRRAVAA